MRARTVGRQPNRGSTPVRIDSEVTRRKCPWGTLRRHLSQSIPSPKKPHRGLFLFHRRYKGLRPEYFAVMFPSAFIQNAGYKVSLRVQSERSGACPHWAIRGGRFAFGSALHSYRTFITRGLYLLTGAARRRRQTEESYTINNDRG